MAAYREAARLTASLLEQRYLNRQAQRLTWSIESGRNDSPQETAALDPGGVYAGTAPATVAARQGVLDAAYAAQPDRFGRRMVSPVRFSPRGPCPTDERC